jgi:hypothetical protein
MIAKNIYFSLFAASAIGSISTLLSPLPASAITLTYTDQASFLSNTSSTYLENFDSLTNNVNPQSFSQGGFSYSVSSDNGLFLSSGNTGSQNLSAYTDFVPLTINFTSNNVTAVGGKFFFTDSASDFTSGTVVLTLNDGTVLNLTSPTSSPTPFGGFTTDGSIITSLTFAAGGSNRFATIDDLYVGTSISATPVPFEFSPNLGIGILGAAWLIRKSLKKKLEKKSEQAEIKG